MRKNTGKVKSQESQGNPKKMAPFFHIPLEFPGSEATHLSLF
ncbi:uncharacterized protein G2W53_031331 [Senna tora]|uniref:Uncharacterized protein n=1 Tax=Senna tora TaxID=362788 RepID=A0A834T8X6_9FABA|nr:uncharacterized protein G2W53_031331 [Senna tora]